MRLIVSLLIFVSFSAHAQSVRAVFKGAQFGARPMTFGLNEDQITRIRELTEGRVNFGDVFYLDVSRDDLATLRDLPGFAGVIEPDIPPPVQIAGSEVQPEKGDPEFSPAWWQQNLRVTEAWEIATGRGVTLADCDAGYYHDEPDLFDNMLLDLRYDLGDSREPLVVNDGPYAYHGTAVAAILAGVRNGAGTNGIAPDAKIVPFQNFNYDGSDTLDKEEATAACVLRAIATPDVDIIVLENQTANGSSETFIGTRDAVRLAQEAGIIVVGAAGNFAVELTEEVKDDTGSIIVGALFQDGTSAGWSNFGSRITVGAYGEGLRTLFGPDGLMGDFGGTSGATPQVAAAVALMKEVNPDLTPELARQILEETRVVDDTNRRTGGLLNLVGAVERARQVVEHDISRRRVFRKQLMEILN